MNVDEVLDHYASIATTGTEYDTEVDKEVVVDTLIRSGPVSLQTRN